LLKLHHINVYILTGGFSRRFGSDKALAPIYNHTFTEELYDKFSAVSNNVSIVGKKKYFEALPFIYDALDLQCPLVGLYTALAHTDTRWNFIVSVDMPYITSDVIDALQKKINNNNIIIPSVNEQLFPLFAFYHQNSLPYFEKAYSVKKYKIMDVISSLNFTGVNLSHYDIELTNVNTRDQLIELDKNSYV